MSELAAFIYWVALTDAQRAWADPHTAAVLSPTHVELNAYLLFDAMMRAKMREYYRFEDKSVMKKKEIPINRKSAAVFKRLLRALDEPFYAHLDANRFQPIISCLKWIRLMFLREFEIHDCLVLWDFILKNFGLRVEIFDFRNGRVLREDHAAVQYFDIFDFVCVALYFVQRPLLMKQDNEIGIVQVLQEAAKCGPFEVMAGAEALVSDLTRALRGRGGPGQGQGKGQAGLAGQDFHGGGGGRRSAPEGAGGGRPGQGGEAGGAEPGRGQGHHFRRQAGLPARAEAAHGEARPGGDHLRPGG